jgi:hypothetical protein
MHYRYQPYPYYRRYYNLDPYYYRRYYPYYNVIDSQIASIDQNITNFGDMRDVSQDANIYQLRTPAPEPVPPVEPPVEEPPTPVAT